METRTPEFDNVIHGFEMLYMDLSKLMLAKVYDVQHAVATKIQIQENSGNQEERKEKECKTLLREKEQEIEAKEQSQLTLVESIKEAVA